MGRAILIILTIAVVMVAVNAGVQTASTTGRQPIQFYPGPNTLGPPVFR